MKVFFKRLLLVIFLIPFYLYAQIDHQKKADKQKWKRIHKEEKAHKKSIKKHHKKWQSKETLKRMKKTKRTANRINKSKPRKPFLRKNERPTKTSFIKKIFKH